MSAFVATMLLPLQRLLPIPPPLLPLPLLQLPLPCHSLFRSLSLLKQLRLSPLSCQGPLQWHPLRGRARSQAPPAPATVVPLSPVLPFSAQPFPEHPLVLCAATRRAFVRRLAICQNAARRPASVPRDAAHHDVARLAAARRDAA